MVFLETPVMRTVARMLAPSTRQRIIWARVSESRRFILTIILERICFGNNKTRTCLFYTFL